MTDRKRFEEMFEYNRGEKLSSEPTPLVVFGRDDPRVPHRAGELIAASLADVIVVTGSANGKDSGDVKNRGFRSEAHFMEHELGAYGAQRGLHLPRIILEEKANNGGENARFSLDALHNEGYLTEGVFALTAVAHATSARRLGATLEREVQKRDGHNISTIYVAPTNYGFHYDNPKDRHEVAAEIKRMHEFPQTGFGVPQDDLTLDGPLGDHIQFAQDYLESLKQSK